MDNIKSYAFDNNGIVNEWEWWKEEYTKSLEEYTKSLNNEVFGLEKRRYSCGSIYCDPDEGNVEYYTQISHFLNAQEEKYISKNKRLHYCVGNYNGASRINVCKDGKFLFCLKTDQFGFSVPKTENISRPQAVHPFCVYYEQEKDKRQAVDNIVRWVYITRSIGGSFIWPEENGKRQPPYNLERGGSRNPRKSSYINDRVDLTLLELKHFFDVKDDFKGEKYDFESFISEYRKNKSGDILGDISLGKSPNLYVWLQHFENFKQFVNYFEFSMFVEDGKVIDITGDGCLDDIIVNKKKVKDGFWNTSFEQVFIKLCTKIEDRTEKMNRVVQKWVQNSSYR